MHGIAELLRRWRGRIVWGQRCVIWFVPVGTPPAFNFPRVGINDSDAFVEVAVGNISLVLLRIDEDLGHAPEVLRVVAAAGKVGDVALVRSRCCARLPAGALLTDL